MLMKYANDMRRIMRAAERSMEEAAPEFRSSQAEVDKAIDAMLSGSMVKPKLQAVVGKDGDVEGLMAELRQALYPIMVNCVQRLGGKVSGASMSTVKSALRGMAQGEEAAPPPPAAVVE